MNTTMVTAFFDIQREDKGDGRKLADYLDWIKHTLQLNCQLFIVTESKFIPFMKKHRPPQYKTFIYEDTFENAEYYKYLPRMREILAREDYKKRIAHPNRVECVLPEYNVIQYSKFGWLNEAIKQNPFNTDNFFWIDAGLSRFFGDLDLARFYPNQSTVDRLDNKFAIQCRHDLLTYPIDDNFIWKSDNLLKGTMFGGSREVVLKMRKDIDDIFVTKMLGKNNVNNEQLAMALAYKHNPGMFYIIEDSHISHIYSIIRKFSL